MPGFFRVLDHGPEFLDRKMCAVAADTGLFVDDRTTGFEENQECGEQLNGQCDEEQDQPYREIERAMQVLVKTVFAQRKIWAECDPLWRDMPYGDAAYRLFVDGAEVQDFNTARFAGDECFYVA